MIDSEKEVFRIYTKVDGLPENDVMSVAHDIDGNIWFTTEHYLCKFDGNKFWYHDARKEIGGFANTSSTIGKGNFILFGGANGFYAFTPDTITPKTPKVVLTNFKTLNKNKDLGKAYELVEDIEVDYLENVLTFEFAALNYIDSKTLDIIISFEGFDPIPINTDSHQNSHKS